MGMAKSFSPLKREEYPVDPSPRRTVAKRIWKNSANYSTNSKVESDYETMLPQLGKLNLSVTTATPIKQTIPQPHSRSTRGHRKPPHPPTPSASSSSSSSSQSSSEDEEQSKYVVFKDKSTLFMPTPGRQNNDPTYARIDENWHETVDWSTDSGISDIYESASQYLTSSEKMLTSPSKSLTSDDLSLISRYDRVLRKRTKKSRFRRLSDFLCSGGSNSDEEEEEIEEDSLYDSLQSSSRSSSSYGLSSSSYFSPSHHGSRDMTGENPVVIAPPYRDVLGNTLPPIAESPPDSMSPEPERKLRYSKEDFFYNPRNKNGNHTTHSEYVLPDDDHQTKYQTPVIRGATPGSGMKQKSHRKQPRMTSTPLRAHTDTDTHMYENVRDFTRKRPKS